MLVYVGTYAKYPPQARGRAEGIYAFRLDPATGALEHAHTVAEVVNPSFLALAPGGRHLYAVNEALETDGQPGGAVSAFAVDPATGALTFLNKQGSHGADPCHLSVDATGQVVVVANYTSGSVALFPIESDGSLAPASDVHQHVGASGVNPRRQEGPHAHMAPIDAANRLVLVPDLGRDEVRLYDLDLANHALRPHTPEAVAFAPGAGPRHLTFHPAAPYAYVIGELGCTIAACRWDAAAGTLEPFQTVPTLPADFSGESTCADIHVAPSGRFVYGSNRGHDSIVTYAIDAATGGLTFVGHTPTGGRTPRNFAIDPSGTFLFAANQNTDTIVTFRLDPASGLPVPTGRVTPVPSPVCLLIAPELG